MNCIRPLLALPLDDWSAAFEYFFDDICDIVNRVNVLRHNLY